MILLLGGSGYVGQAFARALKRQQLPFQVLLRREADYTDFAILLRLLQRIRPAFVINAAGFTGKPNVDACETDQASTIAGNVALPLVIAHACAECDVPWGHVSSGCIYNGAKFFNNGEWRIETNLTSRVAQETIQQSPESVRGFSEADSPNFTFRQPPCSFYSGTKALAEELLASAHRLFIWRLRIPFDHQHHPRNYLSKLLNYRKVYQNINSLSHLGDFVDACLMLFQSNAPYGTYNVTNPGFVSTSEVVAGVREHRCPGRNFEFWENDAEFYREAARTPRSNCILETEKLLRLGIPMRPVKEALHDSLQRWQSEGTG